MKDEHNSNETTDEEVTPTTMVRVSEGNHVLDVCKHFYVRVPKTGSTTLHNTIMQHPEWGICTLKDHTTIPKLDSTNRKNHDKEVETVYLVSIREPYDRFKSQFKYSYQDFGQPGKASAMKLSETYSNIDDFVVALSDSHQKGGSFDNTFYKDVLQSAEYWKPMHHFVPIAWVQENPERIQFLCMSNNKSNSQPPVHVQLGEILGIQLAQAFPHQNVNTLRFDGQGDKDKDNDNTLSNSKQFQLFKNSKELLARTFLKQDLELYRLSGCNRDRNNNHETNSNSGFPTTTSQTMIKSEIVETVDFESTRTMAMALLLSASLLATIIALLYYMVRRQCWKSSGGTKHQ